MGTGGSFPGDKAADACSWSLKPCIVPRLRMRGVTHPFLQYVFMAWYLVKHKDNFTFLFTFGWGELGGPQNRSRHSATASKWYLQWQLGSNESYCAYCPKNGMREDCKHFNAITSWRHFCNNETKWLEYGVFLLDFRNFRYRFLGGGRIHLFSLNVVINF